MANTNVAFGLKPINTAGSAPATQGTNAYFIDSAASAIYQGSMVKADNGGEIVICSASGDTEAPVGVFAGCEYVSSTTGKKVFSNYWPGSGSVSVDTNYPVKAFVADNPDQLFKVASDASLTDRATALATVFANASLGTSARTGSTDTGNSNSALSVSSIATTATLPLRIVGIMDDEANSDFTAAGIPLIVRINAHFNATTSRFDSQTTATTTGV